MTRKIVAVFGATGAQGGGLVDAILADADSKFLPRVLTRDPFQAKAVAYEQSGAQLVACDMDKPETLKAALAGVYGVFVVTNFRDSMDPYREISQAKAVAMAGKNAGVEHFIWSTLDDTTAFFDSLPEDKRPPKLVDDMYVPFMDSKPRADSSFPKEKTTFLYTSCYFENFYNWGQINNGTLTLNMADKAFPVVSVQDIGRCAYAILQAGDEYKSKSVYVVGDKIPCKEMMEIVSNVVSKPYTYSAVDRDTYAGLGFPGAEALANMYYYHVMDPAFSSKRKVDLCKKLLPHLQDTRMWAEAHKEQLKEVGPEDE